MTSADTTALVSTKGGTDEDGRKGEEGQKQAGCARRRFLPSSGGARRLARWSFGDLTAAVSSNLRIEEDKEDTEDDGVVQGSAFDKLPDELLDHILSFLFTKTTRSSRLLRSLVVNKRIYDLARAQQASSWHFDSVVASRFVFERDLHHHVHFLTVETKKDDTALPEMRMMTLSMFSNLTKLEFTGRFQPDYVFEPPSLFVHTLKSLTKLKKLSLLFSSPFCMPRSAALGADLPHLKHLRVNNECKNLPLLLRGEHLSTHSSSTDSSSATIQVCRYHGRRCGA
ncbi:hypothetical protein JCM8547_002631 [Rhodosporidiobolus lusitaniae]